MSKGFPLERMKKGMFFQLSSKEAKDVALRTFEFCDSSASKEIPIKEVKNITKQVYANLGVRKILNEEESLAYFKQLDRDNDGKVRREDFEMIMGEYFVNLDKNGAMDISDANPDIYNISEKEDAKIKTTDGQMAILLKEGVRRYGKDFIDDQLRLCKGLFDATNNTGDTAINFEEMFGMFERLFRKVGIAGSEDNLKIEDVKRLLELMDFHKKGAIGYQEFELFYVKGLLGS